MTEAGLSIRRLAADEIESVSKLARVVWQATYPPLISQAQIDAMLADRYAPDCIRSQLDDPRQAWWVVYKNRKLTGFAHALFEDDSCKLDKLYVHPDSQRQGVGTALEQAVEDWARQHQGRQLRLQVNRGNVQAIAAYLKYGFRIIESRVFDIGNGFVMDDYVMDKLL